MVLIQIQKTNTAQVLLQSASMLAIQLKKTIGVLSFVDADNLIAPRKDELNELLSQQNHTDIPITICNSKTNVLSAICEELDASFLFVQLPNGHTKFIRSLLNDCRDLRIPYLLFKDAFSPMDLKKVILPIGFLEEELEKAQFASAFGRFCQSEIIMLLANDYGSKAANNAEKMKLLFNKFQLNYTLEKAINDSFKVESEAIQLAEKDQAGIIIISASRDYGLDDILFGTKELHLIKKSSIPILLVNPRGDLYALCD